MVVVIGVRFEGDQGVALDRTQVDQVLQGFRDAAPGVEAALLATCERTELHVVGLDVPGALRAFHQALRLEEGHQALRLEEGQRGACLEADPYVHVGVDAVEHICRVAAGLDSKVLGDHDVLGQVRRSLVASESAGTAGPVLRSVHRRAVAAGRRCRTETPIASGITGIAGVVAEVARSAAPGAALVVGTGTVGTAVARRLAKHGRPVTVANRTDSTARSLALEIGGSWCPVSELADPLGAASVVVAAAPLAIDAGHCTTDALLIDVATPAAFVGAGARTITLGAIQARADGTRAARTAALGAAERIVSDAVLRWQADHQLLEVHR